MQKYKRLVESIINRQVSFMRYPGGSDARFFSAKGIPVIMTRGSGGGQHAKDEWASTEDYVISAQILEEYLQNFVD